MDAMETSVLSEGADSQSHQLVDCIKCYLCDHYFSDGEEPCLIFEKHPGAHGQLHDALAGILSSALGVEVSEETAHSELLCKECNYTLREYRTIEQLYYEMRFQILAEYNKTATLNGLPTIPIEINGILQKYLNLGLGVKSQPTDECQQVFLAPKPEDFFEQLPVLGNDAVVDMDDVHVLESLINFETNASEETKDSELLASLEHNDFEQLYNVEIIESQNMANIKIDPEDIICYDMEHFSEVNNEGVAGVNSQCIESLITSSCNNIDNGFNIDPSEDMIWNSCGLEKNVTVLVHLKNQPTNRVNRQTQDSQPQLYTYQDDLYSCLLCSDELKYSRKSFVEHMRAQHNYRFYICNVCGSGFSRRQDLNDHMKQLQHDSFECDICHRVFENYGLLRIHKRINHATCKQFECTKCHKTYTSKHLLDSHMNMHNGLRPHNCALCPKNFTSKYTLRAHMKTHSYRLRPYQCDICEKSFLNSQNLAQHRKVHSGIKPFVCDVCSKAFVTQNNLFRHQTIHSVNKPFKCPACGKAFAREVQMKDHERIHTGERPFKCDICHLSFTQRSNLSSHKKTTHVNENLHKCYHCDLSFTRRRLLDYHMNSAHTAECPNKCAVCGATFECPEQHTKHMLTHVGLKPFACEVCGRQFANRENRNTHRFIHSNKKPYECLACGAGFMRKPLLFAHMKHANHCNDTIIFNQPQIGVYNAVDGENLTVDEGLDLETQSLSQSETERMIAVDMIQLYTSENDTDNCTADAISSVSGLLVKNVEEDVKDFQFEELNVDGPQKFEYDL